MSFIPAQTSGLGTAAQIAVDSTSVALSLTGTTTHQIAASVEDVAGSPNPGTALTLSAAANASSGTTVYTGTITGGGSNAFAGQEFVVAGFTNAANNGTFICTASTTTTLTLGNGAGVAETHAATATSEGGVAVTFVSYNPGVATVSATGLITAVSKGGAVIEASFPAFNNAAGDIVSSGNPMNGLPIAKIYKEINVTVGV
jgi:hypothetical protein